MQNSKIEKFVDDANFYCALWCHNTHIYTLNCLDGINGSKNHFKEYQIKIKEIYDILFENGVDAILFDHATYDYNEVKNNICDVKKKEANSLKKFNQWKKYNHKIYKSVLEDYDEIKNVDRIVCYFNGDENIDFFNLILQNTADSSFI